MTAHRPQADSHARWNQGVGVSTVFHIILLIGFAFLVDHRFESESAPGHVIQTRWTTPRDNEEPEILELTAVTRKQEEASDAAVLSHLSATLDTNSAPDSETLVSSLKGPQPELMQFEESLTTKYAGEVVGALLTSSAIGLTNSGSGNGIGKGEFFGHNPESKRIVYVVDCSKSMNFPHDSIGKTRLGRVKLELARAIFSMDEDQEFFVIFFSDLAIPMPARELQPATSEAKEKFLSWVARVPGIGRTEPLEAMLLALRLQPDTIYFLTDGQFKASTVKAFNRVAEKTSQNHKVIVNGICLGNREGETLIRMLAENNFGSYTFIP